MGHQNNPKQKQVQELRRGIIVLATLSQLGTEHYGYSLKKKMADLGLEVDEGTLYPLLRRLEGQGLLESRWLMEEGRNRRYYQMSASGRDTFEQLREEWHSLVEVMNGFTRDKEEL